MSTLPQFTNFLEQPCLPPSTPAKVWELPAEQPMPSAYTVPLRFTHYHMAGQQLSPDLGLPESNLTIGGRSILVPLKDQIRLLQHRKPPEYTSDFQYFQRQEGNRTVPRDIALNELERVYVFEDRAEVAEFIERNRIRELLLEAREPLNAIFGEEAVKRLTLLDDDEGFTKLFCLILVPGDMVGAGQALRSFDEIWWLARSSQADGRLNFDFEMI